MFPVLPRLIEKQKPSFAMAEISEKPRLNEYEHQQNHQSDEIRRVEGLTHEASNTVSVAPEAIGGHSVADLPPKYFRSLPFIASFLVPATNLYF
jgi:hypothetical protein